MLYFEFNEKFPTEEACIDYFINIRYNKGVVCPHCGCTTHIYHRKDFPKLLICKNCNNHFSIFKGTIFEKSCTDLRKWFLAINFMITDKKGISALQLQRQIGTTYKTAWRILKQIRVAMGNTDFTKAFEAIVEIDETYVGGKPRKKGYIEDKKDDKDDDNNNHNNKPPRNKTGRGTRKTAVVGVKERGSDNVHAVVALPDKDGKRLTGKQLFKILDKVCKDNTTVITDDFKSYGILDRKLENPYIHLKVNHSQGQFSAGNGVHTNGIESFWAVLKRGIYGMYHHISLQHMQRYIDEFCFRANNRKVNRAFETLIGNAIAK
jgi:transposase-like protein